MIISSKFRPYSYQELVAPIAQATEVHNQQLAALGELDANASIWEGMLDKDRDPLAYQRVQNYKNNLEGLVDALNSKGLSGTTIQDFQKSKANYAKLAKPIEDAFNQKKLLEKEQRAAKLKDSSLISDIDMATVSIDDMIANPSLAPRNYSGNLITATVSQQASNLVRQIKNNPNAYSGLLNGALLSFVQREGYSEDAIYKAIQGSPEASKVLLGMVQDSLDATGIANWNNEAAYATARNFANKGLWSAVGNTKYTRIQNPTFDANSFGDTDIPQGAPQSLYREVSRLNIEDTPERLRTKEVLKYVDKVLEDGGKDIEYNQLNASLETVRTALINEGVLTPQEIDAKMEQYKKNYTSFFRSSRNDYEKYVIDILGDSDAKLEMKDGVFTPESIKILKDYKEKATKTLASRELSFAYDPTTYDPLAKLLATRYSQYGGNVDKAAFDLSTWKDSDVDLEETDYENILKTAKSLQIIPGVGYVVVGSIDLGEGQTRDQAIRIDPRLIQDSQESRNLINRIKTNQYKKGKDALGNNYASLKEDMANAIYNVDVTTNTRVQQKTEKTSK